jgi:hypothetical protein
VVTSAALMPGAGDDRPGTGRSGGREANREGFKAVDAGDSSVGGLAGQCKVLDASHEEGERLLQLGPRKVGTQAVMDAGAEGDQAPAVGSRDVEASAVLQAVAVGGDAGHEDDGVRRERDAADLHVLDDESERTLAPWLARRLREPAARASATNRAGSRDFRW